MSAATTATTGMTATTATAARWRCMSTTTAAVVMRLRGVRRIHVR